MAKVIKVNKLKEWIRINKKKYEHFIKDDLKILRRCARVGNYLSAINPALRIADCCINLTLLLDLEQFIEKEAEE